MKKKETVSESYILGIKSGRSYRNRFPDETIDDMVVHRNSCQRLIRAYSQPMKDVFKGERDFWRNQISIKKKEKTNHEL
jgi:hypothetical protein